MGMTYMWECHLCQVPAQVWALGRLPYMGYMYSFCIQVVWSIGDVGVVQLIFYVLHFLLLIIFMSWICVVLANFVIKQQDLDMP